MTGPRMPLGPVFIGEPVVQDDEFSNLRNSLKRSTALRVTEQAAPRVVEAFPHPNYAYPAPRVGLTFWQWCARVIPILVALISSGVLAYFLLVGDRAPPLVGNARQEEAPSSVPIQGKEQRQADEAQQAQVSPDDRAPDPESEPAAVPEQKPIPADLGPRLPMPNDDVLLMLIESSVIALNHANITGNYSVLHEMGAPAFQNANSPEKLAQIFAQLRG